MPSYFTIVNLNCQVAINLALWYVPSIIDVIDAFAMVLVTCTDMTVFKDERSKLLIGITPTCPLADAAFEKTGSSWLVLGRLAQTMLRHSEFWPYRLVRVKSVFMHMVFWGHVAVLVYPLTVPS